MFEYNYELVTPDFQDRKTKPVLSFHKLLNNERSFNFQLSPFNNFILFLLSEIYETSFFVLFFYKFSNLSKVEKNKNGNNFSLSCIEEWLKNNNNYNNKNLTYKAERKKKK